MTPTTPIDFVAPTGGGGGGSFGGSFGGGGIGSGGGSGGDTSTPVVERPPPVTASVPEPATWTSLILGMLVTGIALRRRQYATTASVLTRAAHDTGNDLKGQHNAVQRAARIGHGIEAKHLSIFIGGEPALSR